MQKPGSGFETYKPTFDCVIFVFIISIMKQFFPSIFLCPPSEKFSELHITTYSKLQFQKERQVTFLSLYLNFKCSHSSRWSIHSHVYSLFSVRRLLSVNDVYRPSVLLHKHGHEIHLFLSLPNLLLFWLLNFSIFETFDGDVKM